MTQQMTLGELRVALTKAESAQWVHYDFGGLVPLDFASYRGYYDEIALGWVSGGTCTPQDLFHRCNDASGRVFAGYKGGEYQMRDDTPVWIANEGQCSSTALVGVIDEGYMLVLKTAYLPR